jgi:hypothetical protein
MVSGKNPMIQDRSGLGPPYIFLDKGICL